MKHLKQGKKYSKVLRVLMLSLLIGAIAAACSDSGKAPSTATPIAPKPAPSPIASQVTSSVTTTAAEVAQTAFTYNALGRRDPFAPIIVKEEKKAKAGLLPPLERYGIFEFKLTGIIWQGFGYNALVEGPDGKGYVVRVGTIMGPNRGVVKKITQEKIIIEEKFKNFSGGTERKEIVIELRKKQEGMQ